MKKFIRGVGYAMNGIVYAVKTQRHMQFHVAAAVVVLIAACFCGFSGMEWLALVVTIAIVISAELVNTAVECVVDLACPEQNPLAKAAKDAAAGAVLVIAAAAVVVGVLLFGPHLSRLMG